MGRSLNISTVFGSAVRCAGELDLRYGRWVLSSAAILLLCKLTYSPTLYSVGKHKVINQQSYASVLYFNSEGSVLAEKRKGSRSQTPRYSRRFGFAFGFLQKSPSEVACVCAAHGPCFPENSPIVAQLKYMYVFNRS